MHIVNSCSNPVFIPYAGRGKRGVQLDPQEWGPEVSVDLVGQTKRMPADLETGRILLAVNDTEREALKDVIDEKYLINSQDAAPKAKAASTEKTPAPPKKEEESDVIAEAASAEQDAETEAEEEAAEQAEEEAAEEDADDEEEEVEESSDAGPVDPVAAELIKTLSMLKPRGRSTKLRHLKKSKDAGIIAALPAVIAHFEKPTKKVTVKDTTESETAEDPKEDAPKLTRAELMSAAVKRGLDFDPAASDAELAKALSDADK